MAHITPRRKPARADIIAFWCFVAVLVFLFWPVQCPYCHASDANTKGHCVHRQQTGDCREDYYPAHFNKSTCWWCRGAGDMARLSAWLD
jgi:hypothetical protein